MLSITLSTTPKVFSHLIVNNRAVCCLKMLTDVSPKHSLGPTQPQRIGFEFMAGRGLGDGFGHIAGCLEKGFQLLPGNEDLPQRF